MTSKRAWAALVALSIPLFALSVDLNGVAILLPQIAGDLHVSALTASSVVTAAALGFAAPLLLVGRVADRVGARLILILGVAGFAVSSAMCAVADTWPLLVGGRALQGVASACCFTTSLVAIDAMFDADRRPIAVGIWAAIGGIGGALGPLVASALASAWSWRAFFGVNIALGAVSVVALVILVPRLPGDRTREIHGVRLGFLTLGLALAIGGLQRTGTNGWDDPGAIACIVVSAVILAAVVFWSRAAPRAGPLVIAVVTRVRSFWAGTAVATASNWGSGVALVLVPAALQSARGIDVFESGALFLGFSVPFAVGGSISGPLVRARGGDAVMIGASAVQAVGLALFALVGLDAALGVMLIALALSGFGNGLAYSAATTVALSEIDPSDAGEASGVLTMLRLIGLTVGVAISGSLVSAVDDVAGISSSGIQVALAVGAVVTALGIVFVVKLRPAVAHH